MSTIIYCHLKATLQHCKVLPQTLLASVSGILAHLAPDLQFVEHLQLQSCVVTPVFNLHNHVQVQSCLWQQNVIFLTRC